MKSGLSKGLGLGLRLVRKKGCLLKRRRNVSGYLATVLTATLRLNTHFFRNIRDQIRVSLRVRVKVKVD